MNPKELRKGIIEAYVFLREKNSTIPSDVLDFMLQASKEKLEQYQQYCELDRGTCADQYGINHLTGCNSPSNCKYQINPNVKVAN